MAGLRWEYLEIPAAAARLAELGDEGWELCTGVGERLYFKRPAPTLQERITLEQRAEMLAAGRLRSAGDPGRRPPRLLHPGLLRLLASVGHTDLILVADRGFPPPPGVERIDLALTDGLPTVLDVLRCARSVVAYDRVLAAEEMRAVSPDRARELQALVEPTPVAFVPHAELKGLASTARGTVRTGDAVPYANVLVAVG